MRWRGIAVFFIGPRIDITHMTQVQPEELLVAVRVPRSWAGAHFYFEKITDRQTWDFPLVNVAAALKTDAGGVVQDARVAVGGVACTPRRVVVAEQTVKGKKIDPQLAHVAGQASSRGARPLNYNHFKATLMTNLVTRSLRDAKA